MIWFYVCAAWLVLSVPAALLIGKVIKGADRADARRRDLVHGQRWIR